MRVEFHQMKKGLFRLLGAFHEVERLGRDLLVDRLHPLLRQRTRVLDLSPAKLWITPRGPNFFLKAGSFG